MLTSNVLYHGYNRSIIPSMSSIITQSVVHRDYISSVTDIFFCPQLRKKGVRDAEKKEAMDESLRLMEEVSWTGLRSEP